MSVMGSFATDYVQFIEDYFLCDSLHIDENVVQSDFCLVVLEVMLLRPVVISTQYVDLGTFTQSLHCISILRIEIAKVFLRKL